MRHGVINNRSIRYRNTKTIGFRFFRGFRLCRFRFRSSSFCRLRRKRFFGRYCFRLRFRNDFRNLCLRFFRSGCGFFPYRLRIFFNRCRFRYFRLRLFCGHINRHCVFIQLFFFRNLFVEDLFFIRKRRCQQDAVRGIVKRICNHKYKREEYGTHPLKELF